jgi:putative aminopeptidase FrvX
MVGFDEAYFLETFQKLLSVDSTTGQYEEIQRLLCDMLDELGFGYHVTRKGGVIANLGGEGEALCVTAHLDDIGLMVRRINADGTLNVCPVGGLYPFYCVTENVRVHTRDGRVYTGAVCRSPSSVNVTEEELRSTHRFPSERLRGAGENVKSAGYPRPGDRNGRHDRAGAQARMANGYVKPGL